MKNKMLQLFLLLGLTIGVVGAAQAQVAPFYQADVPFDFTVDGESFEAGEYSISFGIIKTNRSSFLIRSLDGKETAIVNNAFSREAIKPNKNARIVFDKDGDDYILAEIKTSQENFVLFKQRKKQKSVKVTGVEVTMLRK